MSDTNPAAHQFSAQFQKSPEVLFFAPGLINLMGEHTDYNQGLQIFTAINRGVWAAASLRSDNQLYVACNTFPEELRTWEVGALIAQDSEFDWSNILRNLTEQLFSRYALPSGINLYLHSQLPLSAGFSFFYCLVYAAAAAQLHCHNIKFEPAELAQLCWEVKQIYAGRDPTDAKSRVLASAKSGFAYLHDAQNLQLTALTINLHWKIHVIDLNEPKQFLDSAIAQRTVQCQTAAKALGVNHLREVTLEQLEQEKNNLDAIIYTRARHVVTENARCLDMIGLLAGTNRQKLAECFAASQTSLRQDYDVTTERLDSWISQLKSAFGDTIAVRLNGGGFGGSLVLIADEATAASLQLEVKQILPEAELTPIETAGCQLIK
jgi:galactokinase